MMFIMLWRAPQPSLRQHVQCVPHVPDVYVLHFRYVTRETGWSRQMKTDCCAEERMLLMGENTHTYVLATLLLLLY